MRWIVRAHQTFPPKRHFQKQWILYSPSCSVWLRSFPKKMIISLHCEEKVVDVVDQLGSQQAIESFQSWSFIVLNKGWGNSSCRILLKSRASDATAFPSDCWKYVPNSCSYKQSTGASQSLDLLIRWRLTMALIIDLLEVIGLIWLFVSYCGCVRVVIEWSGVIKVLVANVYNSIMNSVSGRTSTIPVCLSCAVSAFLGLRNQRCTILFSCDAGFQRTMCILLLPVKHPRVFPWSVQLTDALSAVRNNRPKHDVFKICWSAAKSTLIVNTYSTKILKALPLLFESNGYYGIQWGQIRY